MKKLKEILKRQSVRQDLLASVVVFLVALPLCMGIAIASGVPPARGLIAGIIGGIVVGAISGSPLQVSGPAAGLAIVIADLVREYGIEVLGAVVLLAGAIQAIAGALKLGQFFRAMSPAVIYGMLAGIGVLICASQLQVAIDAKPHTHGIENLMAIPDLIWQVIQPQGSSHHLAALVSIITIATMLLWDKKLQGSKLGLIPGALIGVIVATSVANILHLPIQHVNISTNLAEAIALPQLGSLFDPKSTPLLLKALEIALIASAESLLSAIAVDRLHQGKRTDFDRELTAQGLGNMMCGFVGALPMTGVIARSSVNVEAGAKTRLSTILHGCWILILAIAAPMLLATIPTASLAAILVVTGFKMIEIDHIRSLSKYGHFPEIIFAGTFLGIIVSDLLTGVSIGVALTIITLILKVSRLNIFIHKNEENCEINIYIEGTATFVQLPKLVAILDRVPPQSDLHLHVDKLVYIDHSCLEFLSTWQKQQEQKDSKVTMPWEKLKQSFYQPFVEFYPSKNSVTTNTKY
jgi:MFS superfamily sulfate permease-like transporter